MKYVSINYGQHCVPNWHWTVNVCQRPYTLWSIWAGKGGLVVGDVEYTLKAGDFFFLNYQKKVIGWQDSPEHPLDVKYIDFRPKRIKDFDNIPEHKHLESTLFARSLFERIQQSQLNKETKQMELWFEALFCEYINARYKVHHGRHWNHIESLCQNIRQNPHKNYSVAKLAKEFACEENHFIRLFKRVTGSSPYAYIQLVRLETAKALLRDSNNPIGEIAEACGFSSLYAFSQFFKNKTGMSATQFRVHT